MYLAEGSLMVLAEVRWMVPGRRLAVTATPGRRPPLLPGLLVLALLLLAQADLVDLGRFCFARSCMCGGRLGTPT